MDWDWFFSSLAQSTAAIVGIFAAFIITKVINNQGEHAKRNNRLRKLLATSEKHRESLNKRSFEWFAKQSLELKLNEVDELLAGGSDAPAEEFWARLHFPEYVSRDLALKRINARIRKYRGRLESADDSTGNINPPIVPRAIPQLALSREKEAIDALVVDIKQHIRLAELHLAEIEENPDTSTLIRPSILGAALLFLLGVVLPLTLLPASEGQNELPGLTDWIGQMMSVKGLLLLVISLIFYGILLMFWVVDTRTRHNRKEVEMLREVTELEKYSPFLLISVENQRLAEEWLNSQKISLDDVLEEENDDVRQ